MSKVNVSKEVQAEVKGYLAQGRVKEDVVVLLSMMYTSMFPSKSDARTWLEEFMEKEGLVSEKPKSMADQLKDWFLAQEDPLKLKKSDIQDQIKKIGMKAGGSTVFYTNIYLTAIELTKELQKKSK